VLFWKAAGARALYRSTEILA